MRRSLLAVLALTLLPQLASAQTSGAPVTYTPQAQSVAGNAATATALAADPADCSPGTTGLATGINASGTAQCSTSVANSTLGTGYLSTTKTAGAAGTTANLLVKIGTDGNVVDLATSDTLGALGIAVSTKTTGQSVEVATRGIVNCIADNTTVIGNILVVGTSTGGRCRDSGMTSTRGVSSQLQIVGKALSVATVGNAVSVQLYGPGHYGGLLSSGRQSVSASGHAATCDLSIGAWCAVTLQGGGADTLTLSNPVTGASYTLELIQPSGSDGTATFPAAVHWPSGISPTLTTTDANVDLVTCKYNGSVYFCGSVFNYAP
jgi:hypothetical protein